MSRPRSPHTAPPNVQTLYGGPLVWGPPASPPETTQRTYTSHLLKTSGQLGTRPTTHQHPLTTTPATTLQSRRRPPHAQPRQPTLGTLYYTAQGYSPSRPLPGLAKSQVPSPGRGSHPILDTLHASCPSAPTGAGQYPTHHHPSPASPHANQQLRLRSLCPGISTSHPNLGTTASSDLSITHGSTHDHTQSHRTESHPNRGY